jgi:hypothetical protein
MFSAGIHWSRWRPISLGSTPTACTPTNAVGALKVPPSWALAPTSPSSSGSQAPSGFGRDDSDAMRRRGMLSAISNGAARKLFVRASVPDRIWSRSNVALPVTRASSASSKMDTVNSVAPFLPSKLPVAARSSMVDSQLGLPTSGSSSSEPGTGSPGSFGLAASAVATAALLPVISRPRVPRLSSRTLGCLSAASRARVKRRLASPAM